MKEFPPLNAELIIVLDVFFFQYSCGTITLTNYIILYSKIESINRPELKVIKQKWNYHSITET